ncbi:MAG: hypothetical protein COB36_11510 [Alphaproteobacteria bacterium]|nr:MAG: hypothetical protein COB36_11510 [Alphaproteobacteria bacterium]
MSHPSPAELDAQALVKESAARTYDQAANAFKFPYQGAGHRAQAAKLSQEAKALRCTASDLRAQGYPFDVSDGKRETSRKAAVKMRRKVGRFHLMVMDALKSRPMTNSEIFDHYRSGLANQDYYTLRDLERSLQPRAGELELIGRVTNTGEKRKNRNGNPEIIWSVAA